MTSNGAGFRAIAVFPQRYQRLTNTHANIMPSRENRAGKEFTVKVPEAIASIKEPELSLHHCRDGLGEGLEMNEATILKTVDLKGRPVEVAVVEDADGRYAALPVDGRGAVGDYLSRMAAEHAQLFPLRSERCR